jgi:zinc transporter ZupT
MMRAHALRLQGLAAGLMLCISMLDLMPSAVGAVGFPAANACFFAGVLFFAVIVALIPEPDATLLLGPQAKDKELPRRGSHGHNLSGYASSSHGSHGHHAASGLGARRPSIDSALGHEARDVNKKAKNARQVLSV